MLIDWREQTKGKRLRMVRTGPRRPITVILGRKKRFTDGEPGFAYHSGEVRFPNGSRMHALFYLCEQDHGEHWETGFVHPQGVIWQSDEQAAEKLAKLGVEELFPYTYHYYTWGDGLFEDFHVDPDTGWST